MLDIAHLCRKAREQADVAITACLPRDWLLLISAPFELQAVAWCETGALTHVQHVVNMLL